MVFVLIEQSDDVGPCFFQCLGEETIVVLGDHHTLEHGIGDELVVRESANDFVAFSSTVFFNGFYKVWVHIPLVDDDRDLGAEPVTQFGNTLEVVQAGWGRLGDNHGEIGASQRADDRTTYAGGAITEDEIVASSFTACARFFFEERDETTGVLFTGKEIGVDHGSEPGVGNEPLTTMPFREINGIGWAELNTNLATLAVERTDPVLAADVGDRTETAHVFTDTTLGADYRINDRFIARPEVFFLDLVWSQKHVQVRGVHIEVTEDGVVGQMGERPGYGGFPRATLTADDDYLTHGAYLLQQHCACLRAVCRTLASRSESLHR